MKRMDWGGFGGVYTQRDAMRLAWDHADKGLSRDALKAQMAADFAEAVRIGLTRIVRNRSGLTPEQYGAALFADGMSKTWLQQPGDRR